MQADAQIIAKLVDNWTDHILQWALILTAVATITMALLELVKAVSFARPLYHRFRLQRWLRGARAYEQLITLAVGGDAKPNALLDQPTNKMMGQVQAAVSVALDFPDRYSDLYSFLTDLTGSDGTVWREFCAALEAGTPTDAQLTAATRARARIDHFVARKLDAFQTVTEYIWARANQFIAVAGSTAFLLIIIAPGAKTFSWRIVIGAIFGGMIAPLAKDVVSALSGLRAGKP
jgi:hypothetical protein